jgi:hypothetical protein
MIVFNATPTPFLAEGVEIWGAIKQDLVCRMLIKGFDLKMLSDKKKRHVHAPNIEHECTKFSRTHTAVQQHASLS